VPSPSTALLRTQTDERLLVLAKAGHERAFEAIVQRYRRPLLRHCRRVLPEARAEDALQQTLLAAWTALRRGDDIAELRPWLYRIAHNSSLNALRVSGYDYDELAESVRVVDAPEDELERRAVVRQTLAGIAALPEAQREALLRTVIEGASQQHIAQELGLSHGAVRQLVHRARTSLRTAATAVVPLPLAGWLAGMGTGGAAPITARMAELAAGAAGGAGGQAGAAGLSGMVAKGAAVAVVAGGAVTGPAIVERVEERAAQRPAAASIAPRASAPGATPTPFQIAGTGRGALRGVPDPAAGGGQGAAGGRAGTGPAAAPGRVGRAGVRAPEAAPFLARPFDSRGTGVADELEDPGGPAPAAAGPDEAAAPAPAGPPTPAGSPAPIPAVPDAPRPVAPEPAPSLPAVDRPGRGSDPAPDRPSAPAPSLPDRPELPDPTPVPTPDPPKSSEQEAPPVEVPTPAPSPDPIPSGSEQTTDEDGDKGKDGKDAPPVGAGAFEDAGDVAEGTLETAQGALP